jgi:hypothetical protein
MDREKKRSKPGPKPTGKGEPVLVRLLPELMTPLDAWAADQDGPPSRPEAIRRILTEYFKRRGLMPKKV